MQTANNGPTCPDPRRVAPWFRAFNQNVVDNVYRQQADPAPGSLHQGYRPKGTVAYILPSQQHGTVSHLRLWVQTVSTPPASGSTTEPTELPFGWHIFKPSWVDHFYTTSASEPYRYQWVQ